MTWHCTASVSASPGQSCLAYDGVFLDGHWVLRGSQALFGWDGRSGRLAWTIGFEDDRPFAMKRLCTTAAGSAVTMIVTDAAGPKPLFAVDPASGRELWHREYLVEPSQVGLVASGNSVFVHGRNRESKFYLLHIDGLTGELLADIPSPSGRGIYASGAHLYLHGQEEGVFHTDCETLAWQRHPVQSMGHLAVRYGQLYFFRKAKAGTGPWELAWWDACEARELISLTSDLPQSMLMALTPEPGQVVLYLDKLGIEMIDMREGRSLWTVEVPADDRLRAVVWTPHGLVVAIKSRVAGGLIEIRDPATGAVREAFTLDEHDPSRLYWSGAQLLVSSVSGLHAFEPT